MDYRAKSLAIVIILLSLWLHFCLTCSNEDPYMCDGEKYEPILLTMNEEESRKPLHLVKRETGALNAVTSEQYCFQFTWPGSDYDETKEYCKDAKKAKLPCFLPYVTTNETNKVPDIDALDVKCDNGNNCNVYCKLTKNANCIRYAFYRDGLMYNATYFCGIVSGTSNHKPGAKPLSTGCDKSKVDSFVLEACYCQTNKCNKFQN